MTGFDIAELYNTGKAKGWLESESPGLARQEFFAANQRGAIGSLFPVTEANFSGLPESFSLHKVARKAIGKDIGGGIQKIGDCVSWGSKHSTEYLTCADMVMRNEREIFRPVFAPYYYGTSRNYVGGNQIRGDGSLGSWMAEAVMKFGTLYADEPGVPEYSGAVATRFGDSNARDDLDKWKPIAVQHLVRSAVKINNWDELCAALANGYPCTIASEQGFNMSASSDGYHRASGSWSHQMMFFGYGPDEVLICNSWGDVFGTLKDFHSDDTLPVGTIRARKKVAEYMINSGECYAFSQHDGTPAQRLDRSAFLLVS